MNDLKDAQFNGTVSTELNILLLISKKTKNNLYLQFVINKYFIFTLIDYNVGI